MRPCEEGVCPPDQLLLSRSFFVERGPTRLRSERDIGTGLRSVSDEIGGTGPYEGFGEDTETAPEDTEFGKSNKLHPHPTEGRGGPKTGPAEKEPFGEGRKGGVAYVLQLTEVGDYEAQNIKLKQMYNRSTTVHFSTMPPILVSCCYKPFIFNN